MNIQPSNPGFNPNSIQQFQSAPAAQKAASANGANEAKATPVDLNIGDLERIQSYVEQLKGMSAVRPEKVAAAKEALDSGVYSSDAAFDKTARGILDELNG